MLALLPPTATLVEPPLRLPLAFCPGKARALRDDGRLMLSQASRS
jgi:hypothetical protein